MLLESDPRNLEYNDEKLVRQKTDLYCSHCNEIFATLNKNMSDEDGRWFVKHSDTEHCKGWQYCPYCGEGLLPSNQRNKT